MPWECAFLLKYILFIYWKYNITNLSYLPENLCRLQISRQSIWTFKMRRSLLIKVKKEKKSRIIIAVPQMIQINKCKWWEPSQYLANYLLLSHQLRLLFYWEPFTAAGTDSCSLGGPEGREGESNLHHRRRLCLSSDTLLHQTPARNKKPTEK